MALGLSNSRLTGLLLLFFVSLVAGQLPNSVTVQVGRKAVLRCDTSQIQFPYETTWEKADGTFLTQGNVFTIETVRLSDMGTYVCRIRNRNDNSQVATSRLELNVVAENGGAPQRSATIRSTPKALERLVMGGQIFRICKVDDPQNGVWTYSWVYPDGRTTSSSMLYITTIGPSHFGTYKCTATNQNGWKLETRFTVSQTTQTGNLRVMVQQISFNDPMILKCSVEGGRPGARYNYEWYKDRRLLARTQQLTVGKLEGSTAGSYECKVTGIGAGGQSRGAFVYDMRLFIKQTETKIALTVPPGPTHIVEAGSSKELHCELDQTQDQQEVARWFIVRQGSTQAEPLGPPLAKIFPTRSVSILIMDKMKVSDTGRYECRVNRNGKMVLREATVVVVQDIGLEVYPSTLTYIMGQTRSNPEFHCQVDNLEGGATALKWTFVPGQTAGAQEQSLPANADASMKPGIRSTSFLTIRNPTMANYGYYVCRAPGGFSGRGALVVRQPNRGRNPVILVVKPSGVITVDPGQTARILCFEGSRVLNVIPDWRVPDNVRSQVKVEVQSGNRILQFQNVRPEQDGTRFTCYYRSAIPVTVTVRVNPSCPRTQRRCRDGTCISGVLFCNGRPDCPDGSDEDRSNCAKCEPNEKECERYNNRDPIKKCVPVHWICDGEDDCGNGFDERSCTVGVGCDKTLFQCNDGRTVPRGFLCDGEKDCSNNDDETGCSTPRIVRPSGRQPVLKRVNRGQELRLICEAQGKGTPKIVWRYNWGFVLAQNRIEERCVDPDTDISTLILSSVNVRDAGIYTCEALNNQGRAFGEDFVVEVNGR